MYIDRQLIEPTYEVDQSRKGISIIILTTNIIHKYTYLNNK